MKSKNKNKSRSSRGGGILDGIKGLFNSGSGSSDDTWNWKKLFGLSKPADSHTEDPKSLSIGTLKIPEAPHVPPVPVQIPGRPTVQQQPDPHQQLQQQQQQQLQSSSSPLSGSSMQAAPAAGGRRRRRTCKKRK
jgi:hypothetical protein